ncbi:OprD family porin [Ramlibacter sp. XY19]|uniref:OprD family outer membrane porin n=1 Tax=Ramlibacter paludis TaxID=2908000 RepID=UPI0023DBF4FB|nr:OprD family outer membrane porin [Ramlibacter paludis]MCG2595048.1 OprD family porin [Ramlibacter paludis]
MPMPPARRSAAALLLAALAMHARADDGYRLPGGFEPILHLRTYYFDQETTSGVPSTAWALGGWAGLRSPWWGDLLQLEIIGYTSQKLYGPEGKGGTRLLTADQGSITVLGEANASLKFAGQVFSAWRQQIDRPFINPNDSRMIPHTFEAYLLSGAAGPARYTGGYVTKVKLRDTDDFAWMSGVAGGAGPHRGVALAGLDYKFGQGGLLRLDEQYSVDVFNSFYADIRYPLELADRTTLVLGAQGYPQRAVGERQIGSFTTWGYGLQAALAHGPFGAQLHWTQTGKGRDTLNPYGQHPSYLNLMQVAFNTAGERAWGLGGDIDFGPFGAPGLKASAIHASGSNRIDFTSGAPLPDRSETNVQLAYAFARGSALAGLTGALRYSWLRQDGAPRAGEQLRLYFNYDVRF